MRAVLANCDRRKKKKSYWFQFPKINTGVFSFIEAAGKEQRR